jgi:DNA replication initiation complex subunit (GINS family)
VDFLRSRAWIEVNRSGASLTPIGENFLEKLDDYIKEVKNIRDIEKRLKKLLRKL